MTHLSHAIAPCNAVRLIDRGSSTHCPLAGPMTALIDKHFEFRDDAIMRQFAKSQVAVLMSAPPTITAISAQNLQDARAKNPRRAHIKPDPLAQFVGWLFLKVCK